MYYVNCYTFLEEPEKDWAKWFRRLRKYLLNQAFLIRVGAYFLIKQARIPIFRGLRARDLCSLEF